MFLLTWWIVDTIKKESRYNRRDKRDTVTRVRSIKFVGNNIQELKEEITYAK